jgi:hypothetical protein
MTITIKQLVADLNTKKTVLLFGAGSSIPSGAPSGTKIIDHFATTFNIEAGHYSLSEIASLIEHKANRRRMIAELRRLCAQLRPQGGLRNLAIYDWKSIYTTNYDDLIEQAYAGRGKKCRIIDSNFDFTISDELYDVELFKIHGTIEKDTSDGHISRIIISEGDYEQTEVFREQLYDRLRGDLPGANLLIVGQSLADPDLKTIVDRAARLNAKAGNQGRIFILVYTKDENRGILFEQRGLTVAFGGIDDFFAELALSSVKADPKSAASGDPIDDVVAMNPFTVDVAKVSDPNKSDVSAMFNGWPASYSDIVMGYTFDRTIAEEIRAYLEGDSSLCAIILGAAGVGKSTAARQAILKMLKTGDRVWQHRSDQRLVKDTWVKVASILRQRGERGVLYIDDAHIHLNDLNDLVDRLAADDNAHLKLICASNRNQWSPRIKTPNIYRYGRDFHLSKLLAPEIERLLQLIDSNDTIRNLVEPIFSGFNNAERRRRLADRCEKDMFVCLKNIFAVEAANL